jgi:hypothetical protein
MKTEPIHATFPVSLPSKLGLTSSVLFGNGQPRSLAHRHSKAQCQSQA